jgi:hypothetical protein
VARPTTNRRKLSEEERRLVEAWALAKTQAKHPGARVNVVVSSQTDEDGQLASYTVLITETATVPLKEIAN